MPLVLLLLALLGTIFVLPDPPAPPLGDWWTASYARARVQIVADDILPATLMFVFFLLVGTLIGSVGSRWMRGRQPADEAPEQTPLGTDQAIRTRDEDSLGFLPFAQRFSRALATLESKDGFVAAVVGPWGSGKTSFLNLALEELELGRSGSTVVRFEPWIFDSDADLAKTFFGVVRDELPSSITFRRISELLRAYPQALDLITAGASPWGPLVATIRRLLVGSDGLLDTRRALAAELRKLTRPIYITIDDIDRLQVNQIAAVLQLVKAQAQLPNLVYVLLMDKHVVATAMTRDGLDGYGYLEKIIQLEIPVPRADRSRLTAILEPRLDEIIAPMPPDQWNAGRWFDAYRRGIAEFIRTPRDVNRYIASLNATAPAIIDHVDMVDYLALQALRLFAPRVYDGILERRAWLLGEAHSTSGEQEQREGAIKALVQLASPGNQSATESLLRNLFPDQIHDRLFDRSRRLCSSPHFSVYFEHTLPSGIPSRSFVIDFVELPLEEARERLRLLREGAFPGSTLIGLLEGLRWHGPKLDEAARQTIAIVLAELVEAIDVSGQAGMDSPEGRLASRLLEDLVGLGDGYALSWPLLLAVITESGEMAASVALVDQVLYPSGAIGSRAYSPDGATRDALAGITVRKLEAVTDAEWALHRSGAYLLFVWRRLLPETERPMEIVSRMLTGEAGDPTRFVDSFVGEVHSSDVTGPQYRFGASTEELVALDELKDRLTTLQGRGLLSERARQALEDLRENGWYESFGRRRR